MGENTKAQLAQSAAYNLARIDAELRNQNLTKEYRDDLLVQRKIENDRLDASRGDTLEEKKQARSDLNLRSARDDLREMEKNWATRLQNQYINKNPFFQNDPKAKAAFDADVAKLYSNPKYLNLQKQAYPNVEFDEPSASYEGYSGKKLKG